MNTLQLTAAHAHSISTVWVGRGIIARLAELLPHNKFSRAVVVADQGALSVLPAVLQALSLSEDSSLQIHGGEQSKTATELQSLWSFFLEQHLDRHSLVFALGGGATTDVVGFAAATYMRGMSVVNIPTTLLAQVDASVGGKTGINFGGIKNVIGAIGQPRGVVVDIDTLNTLSPRELRSGFAEIIKHGLIADADYFQRTTSKPCSAWSSDELTELVLRSCQIKKSVVESDEAEAGPRKVLNFGHTIGHAIEALTLQTPSPLTHGEAVAIGMAAESHLSLSAGFISDREYASIIAGISAVELPTKLALEIDGSLLHTSILRDKKNSGGTVKWTLLNRIGHAIFDRETLEAQVHSAILSIQP